MQDSANQLPSECIGCDRLLSRALYRVAMDCTQVERPSLIYGYRPKLAPEIIAHHIRLLPEHAIIAIRDAFDHLADQQQILQAVRNSPNSEVSCDHLDAWVDAVPGAWVSQLRRHLEGSSSSDP